ncbi:MAG: flagellar biosynthesis anti-sigma factor FlgM [Thermanaerothrix sp.]|nr:flagellar biosynthesis anti-sigma factor FlgM [Thermanaerothrix sp.]
MIDRIDRIYGGHPVDRKSRRAYGGAVDGAGKDHVEVSSFGKELASAVKEMQKLPDVRADKIEELRSRIEAGSYRPDLGVLAERLLKAGITRGV